MTKLYILKPIGRTVGGAIVEAVNRFWQPWEVSLDMGEPFPPQHFPTHQSLNDWLYQIYLQHYQQGTFPNMVVVVPGEHLGSWRWAWEGTTYDTWHLAALKEQVGPAMRFVAAHEVGHLLGLPDHWWPPTCIMAWYPWFLIPLMLRSVCAGCKAILERGGIDA